ncbi:MAG: UDP-N-acetylmuramoyl-tripeptide--D-alanyl-D-alanine ligase [Vicingaceae bacterium]
MPEIEELYQIYLKHPLVCTDTRIITKECMFFALKGDNFNGNAYALEALEKGAAYAVIDEAQDLKDPRLILVDDVLIALQKLARHHRDHYKSPVIGITGSNGKTTTKELMNAVLSSQFKVHATGGNFNNHIGVPLTLLGLRNDHQLAIIEMGANRMGEITELCLISDPDVGLVTNIGKAHLQGFGSYEGVKQTKLGLFKHVQAKNGLLFVNADDPVLMAASEGYQRLTYGRSGTGLEADYFVNSEGCLSLRLTLGGQQHELPTQLYGSFNFYNVLAAVAIGLHFNVSLDNIKSALRNYLPTNNRSQILKKGTNRIIMDAYNANPSSMKLAIDSFVDFPGDKKMLLLGDMLELGEVSRDEHLSVAAQLSSCGFEEVCLVGKEFSAISAPFKTFETTEELKKYLESRKYSGYSILMKGSRGIGLEKVLDVLN